MKSRRDFWKVDNLVRMSLLDPFEGVNISRLIHKISRDILWKGLCGSNQKLTYCLLVSDRCDHSYFSC